MNPYAGHILWLRAAADARDKGDHDIVIVARTDTVAGGKSFRGSLESTSGRSSSQLNAFSTMLEVLISGPIA
jgi:2-methylisocitrate lyase-like PEP mutase family enzyme